MTIDLDMFCASMKHWIYCELEGEILLQSHAMAPYLDFVLDLVAALWRSTNINIIEWVLPIK